MLQSTIQSLSLHALPPPLSPFPSLNALLLPPPPSLVLIALRKNSISQVIHFSAKLFKFKRRFLERLEDSDEETNQPDSKEEMPRKKEESSAEKRVDNQQELVKKVFEY